MCDVEPPRQQGRQGVPRLLRHRQRAVLAEQGDADRPGVEPLRVGADHVPLDPAVAALEDLAEAVDEEVVADVVPAVPLDVVELDRPHDRRRLGGAVPIRAGRVVHEREPQDGRERGLGAPDLLVRVPAAPRHDGGRAGLLELASGDARGRAPDEEGAQPRHLAAEAVLDSVGGADPPRVAEVPGAGAGTLGGARVGTVLGLGRRVGPTTPAAGERAGAELHRAAADPVQADEVELRRRLVRGERPSAVQRHVA